MYEGWLPEHPSAESIDGARKKRFGRGGNAAPRGGGTGLGLLGEPDVELSMARSMEPTWPGVNRRPSPSRTVAHIQVPA